MNRLALDRGYETGAVHRGLELLGITGYIPAIQFSNPPEKYGFSYDPQLDAFICPEGVPLTYHRLNCSKSTGKYLRCYQVEGDFCMRCPKRSSCFDKAGIRRRVLASSCYPAFFRGHQRVGTPEYLSMMRLRKIWAEGSFSVLKREHCISRIRKRGILAATEECLLAAMALNLKRMVSAIFRYPQIYYSAGTITIRRKTSPNSEYYYDYNLYDPMFTLDQGVTQWEVHLYFTGYFLWIETRNTRQLLNNKWHAPIFFGINLPNMDYMGNYLGRSSSSYIIFGDSNPSTTFTMPDEIAIYEFKYAELKDELQTHFSDDN